MRKRVVLGIVICAAPLLAAAEDLLPTYREAADLCVQNVDARGGEAQCRGIIFAACRPAEGIEACMQAEARFWEEQVERQYAGALEEMNRQDKLYPLAANRAAALAKSQAAWREFQAAECELMDLNTSSAAYCFESTGFTRAMRLIDLQEPLQ